MKMDKIKKKSKKKIQNKKRSTKRKMIIIERPNK
jgi:hypothetical protein